MKYSIEFKLDAVSLVADRGYSRAEAAQSLNFNANMLGYWVKEVRAGDAHNFPGEWHKA